MPFDDVGEVDGLAIVPLVLSGVVELEPAEPEPLVGDGIAEPAAPEASGIAEPDADPEFIVPDPIGDPEAPAAVTLTGTVTSGAPSNDIVMLNVWPTVSGAFKSFNMM